MKYFLIIALFIANISNSFSAEPLIKVGSLPSGSELELYEDSEGLFAMKVIEYYRAAVVLEAQLLLMGIDPSNPIAAPTLDDLEDMDIRTLRRFHAQANGLMRQVQSAPEGIFHRKIDELRLKLEQMNKNNFILQEQIHQNNLDLLSSDFYRSRYRELIKQNDSLRVVIDEILLENSKNMWEYHNSLRKIYTSGNLHSIISLSLAGNFIDFRSDDISSNISGSVMMNFHPGPVFGYGKFIDIWAEYLYPSIESNAPIANEYRTNMYTTGFNFNIPLSEIMKIDNYYLGLKGGYGYFWGDARLPNTQNATNKWQGQIIRLEVCAANFNKSFFPMGVFIAYNFYNYNKKLEFSTANKPINLGKPWINNFQLGVRFSLLQSPNHYYN